jgi:tetratricopeptide (TPR) repeat protein
MTGDSAKLRDAALKHYKAGRFAEAVQLQVQVVNAIGGLNPDSLDDQKRLAAFLFAAGDHKSTAAVMGQVVRLAPDDAESLTNHGVALSRIGQHEAAVQSLERAVERAPDALNTRDALAAACYRLKRFDEARAHGEKSLELKDAGAASQKAFSIPARLPAFSSDDPTCNIIAFSLWGDGRKYCDGAVANAESSASLYPGWTCRFYVDDTVPKPVRDKLTAAGAQVQMMTRKNTFDGLFWRFLPINDGHTRHFLVRDADSVINLREKAAVDEWLASGKAFHVMRDWWTHTEVMLAGLWGGVGGALPPVTDLLKDFKSPSLANWHLDQWFLRQMVWPTARQSCLIHDSKYRALGAKDFPAGSDLPPGHHVGQDASVHNQAMPGKV